MKIIFLIVALAFVACDRPADPPGQAAQNKKDDEGNAWRGLLHKLEAAATPESKIRVLDEFIASHPDHPDLPEAKRRLDELKNDPDAKAKKLVAEVGQKAIEEGQPQAFVALFASDLARQHRENMQRDALKAPLTVPTLDGNVEVAKSVFVHPTVGRGFVLRTLLRVAKDKLEERCDRMCVNEALGGFLKGTIGGPLWLEDGKMNPDAVGPLLEKAWVDPDSELLGVSARSWYAIFRPTAAAYIRTHQAMKDSNAAAKATELAGLSDRAATSKLYTEFAEQNELATKTELAAGDARSIAGWWLRRHADGTAELFAGFAARVIEGYDPELAPPAK